MSWLQHIEFDLRPILSCWSKCDCWVMNDTLTDCHSGNVSLLKLLDLSVAFDAIDYTIIVWGAAKTVHMGHQIFLDNNIVLLFSLFWAIGFLFEGSSYLSSWDIYNSMMRGKKTLQLRKTALKFGYRFSHLEMRSLILHRSQTL